MIRTKVVDEWELAGCPESGKRPGEGQPIGTMRGRGIEVPLVKYTVAAPTEYIEGDLESLPFYAGESVSLVREILPAREIEKKIAEEACGAISDRLIPLTK
ncbi:MAG: hypothetical protein JO121_15205 [Deltaproteobacteria bacterium]|nr:hypothetical protein [Deltaproteobacteria bacterium]